MILEAKVEYTQLLENIVYHLANLHRTYINTDFIFLRKFAEYMIHTPEFYNKFLDEFNKIIVPDNNLQTVEYFTIILGVEMEEFLDIISYQTFYTLRILGLFPKEFNPEQPLRFLNSLQKLFMLNSKYDLSDIFN